MVLEWVEKARLDPAPLWKQFELSEGTVMTFINEYISAEDVAKYQIGDIDRRFLKVTYKPEWTVDKKRDIYLRLVGSGREEFASHKDFTLYWQGALYVLRLDQKSQRTADGMPSLHYELLRATPSDALQHPELLAHLKEALTVYQGGGVHSGHGVRPVTFSF